MTDALIRGRKIQRAFADISSVWLGIGVVVLVLLALTAAVRPALFIDTLISGFVYGMILVMIALGLSLILGLMGVVNFAHGALFMLGAYAAFQVVAVLGLSFWVALVIAPLAVGIIAIVLEMSVLRHLYDEGPIIGLLATFGLALMLEELTRAIWGNAPRNFSVPPVLSAPTDLVVTTVPTIRLFIAAVTLVTVLVVYLLITRTEFGLTIRSGVQDREMTAFLGVNLPVRFTAMFFLGSVIAALGGVLRGAEVGADLAMANQFIILAFIVVVVGGIGSLFGSVVSGLLIGEAVFLTPIVLESLARVTGIAALNVGGIGGLVPYLVMIVVLLVQPRGLFGEEGFLE